MEVVRQAVNSKVKEPPERS